MEEPYIRHLEVLGFEKRFVPNQYYVYMLMVKWSDLSEKLIYRKFSEIYDFHKMLKELFPIEAGEIDSKARTLPHLPAPRWLEGHKATENRQSTLSEYFQSLLNLPSKISRCQWIVSFLQVRPDDVALPLPHPTKKTETYLLPKGRARSSSSGWWFCQLEGRRGWLPAAYLEPLDSPDENEEQEPNYEGEVYKVIHSYRAGQKDELSLSEDELVDVIHKLLDGWWVVRKGEITGYYPSMHLEKSGTALNTGFNMKKGHLPPPRRSTIRNAQSIHVVERKQISQDSYRRNSRRYLQQKGTEDHTIVSRNAWKQKQDPRTVATGGTNQEEERQKKVPEIPPRPTLSEILAHCTEQTKSKINLQANPV
ncbi:neutrophil cytosol factor 1 isoform X3 [Rhinoraja longicauda]